MNYRAQQSQSRFPRNNAPLLGLSRAPIPQPMRLRAALYDLNRAHSPRHGRHALRYAFAWRVRINRGCRLQAVKNQNHRDAQSPDLQLNQSAPPAHIGACGCITVVHRVPSHVNVSLTHPNPPHRLISMHRLN